MKPTNFTSREWLDKAHIKLMRHPTWVAFSGVVACGETTLTDAVPTACTDGWNVTYSPKFIDGLTFPELCFVVLHENLHKAFRHLTVWRHLWKQDGQRANVAADMFINLALMDDNADGFLAMPKVGIQPDPQYRGMSVGQIFDALGKKPPQGQPGKPGSSGDGQPNGASGEGSMDKHDWQGAEEHAQGKDGEDRTDAIERAIRQGQILRQRTKMGAGSQPGVFDLLTPKVDWREVLRDFISATCRGHDESTWSRTNRRFLDQGIYMPGSISTQAGDLVIGIDTSGSCFGTATMSRFMTELTAIVEATKPSKVHVIYWDTRVAGHQVFDDGQFAVLGLKPAGGGGTDGAVLFDYLREQRISCSAVIQFTDGEVGDWGSCDVPTLWAVTTHAKAPFGTTINISE